MALDLEQHLCRQIAFSRATFGPGQRTAGILDHIRKELVAVEEAGGTPEEWVDVVILALDGLTRSILYAPLGFSSTDDAAAQAAHMIRERQGINELRSWPDWRTAKPSRAIEHERAANRPSITDCGCGLCAGACGLEKAETQPPCNPRPGSRP